jgi:hypothetical protein
LKKEKEGWGDESGEERLGEEKSEQQRIEVSKRCGMEGVHKNEDEKTF